MKPADEDKVREILGREPDAVEVGSYDSFDSLPAAVEDVALMIASQRDLVLGCKYLFERVPNGDFQDAKLKLDSLMERRAR